MLHMPHRRQMSMPSALQSPTDRMTVTSVSDKSSKSWPVIQICIKSWPTLCAVFHNMVKHPFEGCIPQKRRDKEERKTDSRSESQSLISSGIFCASANHEQHMMSHNIADTKHSLKESVHTVLPSCFWCTQLLFEIKKYEEILAIFLPLQSLGRSGNCPASPARPPANVICVESRWGVAIAMQATSHYKLMKRCHEHGPPKIDVMSYHVRNLQPWVWASAQA